MNLLPINIDDLVQARTVESNRIEYKRGFSVATKPHIIATIVAFANDFQNVNGGYVIIGIDTKDGLPILPPAGLPAESLEATQQEIRRLCKTRVQTEFQPIIVPLVYDSKHLLVVWAPASDNRPHIGPDPRNFSENCLPIRVNSETVKATTAQEAQLREQTAKIPFDDRPNHASTLTDISPLLVKRFLQDIGSDLLNSTPPIPDTALYESIRVTKDVGGKLVPRNIGLLFFAEKPERHFPGCKLELAMYRDDAGGNLFEEKLFTGPISYQITEILSYLENLTNAHVRKIPGRALAERTVGYPYEALEEAVVNAYYHRGYDQPSEPNKIHVYPDRLEIISYPGPVPGITMEHLQSARPVPPVPARNRRIGELLKELQLAEMRGTGIPKMRRVMADHGSSRPVFDFDVERTYFRVILPAHPKYIVLQAVSEAAYMWSIGERAPAIRRLEDVFKGQPSSGAVAAQLIQFYAERDDLPAAERVFNEFRAQPLRSEGEQPYLRMFRIYLGSNLNLKARQVIDELPETEYANAPYDVAIAFKRVRENQKAHVLMAQVYASFDTNSEFLHDYAKVKIAIANEMYHARNTNWHTIKRLRLEAIELLRRSTQLGVDPQQIAWYYLDLAVTLQRVRGQARDIRAAYDNAIKLLPTEEKFKSSYAEWEARNARSPR
ncbi:putative DNA binding domain-containing protein [candidate division KSB1 bacterium]|nr:putative DNA binding domain-containing protein [candidate division KSB1 bacterium]